MLLEPSQILSLVNDIAIINQLSIVFSSTPITFNYMDIAYDPDGPRLRVNSLGKLL